MRLDSLIVWGNGSTLNCNGKFHIPERTSNLLSNLAPKFTQVNWCEVIVEDTERVGLKTDGLNDKVKYIPKNFRSFLKGLFSYNLLFLPSRSNLILGLFYSLVFRKKVHIYLRGEARNMKLFYQVLFLSKRVEVLLVSELLLRDYRVNAIVTKIKPLIHPVFHETAIVDKLPREVIFVGRVEEDKGIIELCEAFKDFKDELELSVVGDGPLLEDLKRHNPHIRFMGLISEPQELFDIYSRSGLVILPSYHEGFPRVLVEGALCGCCIMSTLVGGVPEVFNGQGFYPVLVKDWASINDQIQRYLLDVKSGNLTTQRARVLSLLFKERKELYEIF